MSVAGNTHPQGNKRAEQAQLELPALRFFLATRQFQTKFRQTGNGQKWTADDS
jgi:hypothetical protein